MIWIGWQAAGQTALDWDYFAYALVPSCFVGMAGLLKLAWREPYERHPLLIAVATAAALALSLSGAVESVVHPIEAAVGGVIMPAAGLVFGVAFAAAFLRPATAALPAFVIAFALANRIAAPGAPANYAVTDPARHDQTSTRRSSTPRRGSTRSTRRTRGSAPGSTIVSASPSDRTTAALARATSGNR